MSTPSFLPVASSTLTIEGTCTLSRHTEPLFDARVKPLAGVTYDVEDYYVAGGFPVAHRSTGVMVPVEAGIGELLIVTTTPAVLDTDVGARCRWLPLAGTFDDPNTWVNAQGSDRVELVTDGTSPELDVDYTFDFGPVETSGTAMRLAGDAYFAADALEWTADSLAFAVVAVLHPPSQDAYGLLETYPFDGSQPNRSFVGLRYNLDGSVETNSRGPQDVRQTSVGGLRTGQPIIAAIYLEQPVLAHSVLVDRTTTVFNFRLTDPHPTDARMYVGRSPALQLGNATMDILEVDYWTDIDEDTLRKHLSTLDQLYGVSL